MSNADRPSATQGARMNYLIRRRPDASREELIMHWFANHMPDVVHRQQLQASAGKVAASRYIATLFDPDTSGRSAWDGVAQLWFDRVLPTPDEPIGTRPADSFQQKAEPYLPWATTEYVVLGGELPVAPLTLNPPFPTTRSGFCKITFLVGASPGIDHGAFFDHWLDVHVPNVAEVLERTGGFRYVVAHSTAPEAAPYAGMAELYFPDADGWQAYREAIRPDGMEAYVGAVEVRTSGTEMIGIP